MTLVDSGMPIAHGVSVTTSPDVLAIVRAPVPVVAVDVKNVSIAY
ncbi:hypothetical protein [Acidovorax sp. FHTAMBA]|jgi:hypothetical protein